MESEKRKSKERKKGKGPQFPEPLADRLTYSESVRINIGDYEHRDIFAAFATNLNDGESFDAAFNRARKKVTAKLYKREKKLRSSSQEFVDFETKAKLI